MTTSFGDELRKLLLAGIGVAALTIEKSRDLIDELVKKGELTIEQGKVLNEELKHNFKDALKKSAAVNIPEEKLTASLVDSLDKLTPAELSSLKKKLASMEKKAKANGSNK